MANRFIQLAKLGRLIVRKGAFPTNRTDYWKARKETLERLSGLPAVLTFGNRPPGIIKSWISKGKYGGYLLAQAAFIKNALRPAAGHLFVPHLQVAYVRNPKAASTSLSYTLLLKIYPELKNANPTAEAVNFLADVNLKKNISHEEKPATYFMVVRNPFARIVSVYRDFFERPGAHFIYADYLFGILKKTFSFSEFVDALHDIPDFLKDQHVKPQKRFLTYYHKRSIAVKTLKLEEPGKISEFLQRFDLSLMVMNQDSAARDFRTYYDLESLQKVHRLYADDISFFEYEQEYQDLKKSIVLKKDP